MTLLEQRGSDQDQFSEILAEGLTYPEVDKEPFEGPGELQPRSQSPLPALKQTPVTDGGTSVLPGDTQHVPVFWWRRGAKVRVLRCRSRGFSQLGVGSPPNFVRILSFLATSVVGVAMAVFFRCLILG